MPDDIAFLPATRLLALYRSKDLSPVEAVDEAAVTRSLQISG